MRHDLDIKASGYSSSIWCQGEIRGPVHCSQPLGIFTARGRYTIKYWAFRIFENLMGNYLVTLLLLKNISSITQIKLHIHEFLIILRGMKNVLDDEFLRFDNET